MIGWSLPKYCWSGLPGKQLYSALETFLFFSCCCCADTAGGVLDGTGWRAVVSRVRAMSAGLLVAVLECVSSTHFMPASSTHCVTASSAHCVTVSSTHCVAASSTHCVTAPSAHCVTASSTPCVTVSSTHCVTDSYTCCVTVSSWHCSWGGIAGAAAGSSADCVAGDWVPILWALCACALLNVVLVLAMMLMPFSGVAGSLHQFFRTCSGTQCCCTDPEAV